MGFIPADARWYLADIILELQVEGDPRNLVQTNVHLIEADSPDRAHDKAVVLGRAAEDDYPNTDGRRVRVVFRGIGHLGVIHDPLEDGAELEYREAVGIPEDQIGALIPLRHNLSVFAPRRPKDDGPNTMPEEIMRLLEAEGTGRDEIRPPGRS